MQHLPKLVGTVGALAIALGSWGGALAVEQMPAPKQATDSSEDTSSDFDPRFQCQVVDGEYVVVYLPESQPDEAYPWAQPTAMGGGWTPERRCAEISRRLELYRPDGLLEMQTAIENGYDTVCVTTERDSSCRIVLTVPEGQDPIATRDRVFENIVVADSGQQTDAVNTLVGDDNDILGQIGDVLGIPGVGRRSSSSINLRPFLDPADGGTGEQLDLGASSGSRQLNPDGFR
ncbi:COP23 domain-containing protein [Vacuolonema iberomarrocanum]|uniref:COP23 domain-containing protein n=1 Tax=Vacuolonema iberomarrocanum TaxID=3454632 RepID=UPI0019FB8D2C|nr:hypothetical protein [filamentous cyanobacterium LEGE 07170]